MTETSSSGARSRVRSPTPASLPALLTGSAAILICLAGGVAIRLLGNGPLGMDVAWYDFSTATLTSPVLAASEFLNVAGAQNVVGFVIPVVAALVFAALRRGWAAVAVLLCGIATAPLVDGIKSVLERPRPDGQLISVSLTAYPSGHVANLTAVLVVLSLIVGWRWFSVVTVALVVAMSLSRTYLNVHWITDDIGGLLLGAGIALITWGLLARRIRAERTTQLADG